tara:strand:- start:1869 stop:3227 length:1359 start_codon:yes stop_codon:yes gene_type:complete
MSNIDISYNPYIWKEWLNENNIIINESLLNNIDYKEIEDDFIIYNLNTWCSNYFPTNIFTYTRHDLIDKNLYRYNYYKNYIQDNNILLPSNNFETSNLDTFNLENGLIYNSVISNYIPSFYDTHLNILSSNIQIKMKNIWEKTNKDNISVNITDWINNNFNDNLLLKNKINNELIEINNIINNGKPFLNVINNYLDETIMNNNNIIFDLNEPIVELISNYYKTLYIKEEFAEIVNISDIDSIDRLKTHYDIKIVNNKYQYSDITSNIISKKFYYIKNKNNNYVNLFISNMNTPYLSTNSSNISEGYNEYYINNKLSINNELWDNINNNIYDWCNNIIYNNLLNKCEYIPTSSNLEFNNNNDINLEKFNSNYSIEIERIELNSEYKPTNWNINYNIINKESNYNQLTICSMVEIDETLIEENIINLLDKSWNKSKDIIESELININLANFYDI